MVHCVEWVNRRHFKYPDLKDYIMNLTWTHNELEWGQSYISQVLTLNTNYLSTVAHTIDCVCSKILKHGLNHGLLFPLVKFFGWKNHFRLTWKFRIKIWILILFNISILPDVQANLSDTSPFFVCPNGFGEHLFANFHSTWKI